ncbi:MAG: OmpA family protein [Gloeobacteraceae cyanobacterium ES-bin-144]|nr:OmpA family protein [Verrucomicrobiales bacterium]
MQRSKLPYFFLGLSAVLALAAVALLILRPGVAPKASPEKKQPARANNASSTKNDAPEDTVPGDAPNITPKPNPQKFAASEPIEVVRQFTKALETGDLTALNQALGKVSLDPKASERLKALASSGLKIRQPNGIREVGELELNLRTRWSIELDGLEAGRNNIFLDLKRNGQTWEIEKITFPPDVGEPIPKALMADSLGVADAFVQAVLKQDFEFARAFVNPATVSDAKIAGLCILFEEGEYHLRKSKALRSMFQRPDTAGYLANLETLDGSQSAQFSITLIQPPAPSNWLVSEINLDQLLAAYAKRVAGGDVYFSPLVKNPAGGDTLALYFEFDEDVINPRTRRQLEIVSQILRTDPGKKLTLSGHTDALGTADYNQTLSERRAKVVRDFLINSGVTTSQIVMIARGASQPRRPNITETGGDNPEGRRVNRRTEIYLDF